MTSSWSCPPSRCATSRASPTQLWRATEERWADAAPPLDDVVAPRDARQAQVVLRGLTSSGGGMVAAATTSLPERAEEGRNYDYRYAWIRDQVYAGRAAAAAGAFSLLDDAVRVHLRPAARRRPEAGPGLHRRRRPRAGPAPTSTCPATPAGYDLVGNWVNRQFQLDALGESLLLLAAAGEHDRLDSDGRKAAEIAADAIAQRWREPDAGIWEIDNQAWTHSRLICAAGLRRAAMHLHHRAAGLGLVRARRRHRRGHRASTRCIRPGAGSAPPATLAWTPRC